MPTENTAKSPDFSDLTALLRVFFYRGTLNPVRQLQAIDPAGIQLLGLVVPISRETPLDFSSLIRESDRERVGQEIATALAAGNSFQVEYHLRHAHGHWLNVCEQGRAVRGSDNQLLGVEGHIMDITDRVIKERARHQSEFEAFQSTKCKSISVLACGVAHDFNNVIAGILGSAELIKMEMEDQGNTSSQEFLQQIFMAGDRARELIHQIKDFGQRLPAERRLIQLPPVIHETAQLVRSIIPDKLEMVYEPDICKPDKEYPAILADVAQIQQALLNLCTHAWHSMPAGKGRIELKLGLRESALETATLPLAVPGVSYLCLSIADNGPGMSKSTLERVFEPFAHRRSNGKKSGLELFVVQEIMTAHEGTIWLESQPGQGTVFHLCFPLPQ